jgi:hypothetical protein
MRWLGVALCLLGLAFATGCGDAEDTGSADLPDALGYVPRDATAVAIVPTDLESEQLNRLHRLLEPTLREAGVSGSLREAIAGLFVDEGVDVDPLLGGTLVMSLGNADEDTALFVLETSDGEKAAALLRRLEAGRVAVDGDTVLVADAFDENAQLLDEAIARQEAGEGFDPAEFERALGDAADDEALVRLYTSPELLKSLASDADLPWLNAVRSGGASLRLESDAITAGALIRTDPEGLSDDDLPLEAGEEAPEVPDVEGALNGANRNQSRTTVFLAQLARKAYPDSQFVREVEALEADLGVSFEEEVLKQFDGPSASIAYANGHFGAVSEIADPDRMRELLPRLAPRLPAILRGLQGLGDEALMALLLFAPDAPLVPGALPLLQGGIDVQRLEGDLYEISGLAEGDQAFAGPGTIVFGLLDDRFVVATDLERARAAAELEVSEVDDAEGAAVGRTDLSSWGNAWLERELGLPIRRLGEATGALEASTEGLEGELRIAVPDGLD